MLEEGSFRGRTADFVFMFIFGGAIMTVSFFSNKNVLDLIVAIYLHFAESLLAFQILVGE